MTHSSMVLVSTALLVMGAGVVVGRLSDRLPAVSAPVHQAPPARPASWQDQLGLTTDQRQKMDAIWVDTQRNFDKAFAGRPELNKERDQAIQALLGPQQWAAYEQIMADFRAKSDELFRERSKLVQDADARSRALLDPDQQKKWDLLTKQMRDRHGPPRPGSERGPGAGPGPGMGLGPPGERTHRDRGFGDSSTTKPTGGDDTDHAGADGNRA